MRDHTSRFSADHVKSILDKIRSGELPFKEVLSPELLSKMLEALSIATEFLRQT